MSASVLHPCARGCAISYECLCLRLCFILLHGVVRLATSVYVCICPLCTGLYDWLRVSMSASASVPVCQCKLFAAVGTTILANKGGKIIKIDHQLVA